MPVNDFSCNQCGCQFESIADLHGMECNGVCTFHPDCTGAIKKEISFGVGRIEGAGGSPARKP